MTVLKETAEKYQPYDLQKIEEIYQTFIDLLSQIPTVEAILTTQEGRVFCFWSVVNWLDDAIEDEIYQREGELMDRFPEDLFDFHLIERRDRNLEEIISPSSFAVYYLR
ncbi:MAG TPA: hypothetical protein EYP19_01690 [Desulfobacterales bacterium]|nr:hypothetical protein [Desulfobacterales bacterium]